MRLRALALLCCMASVGSALVHANAPAGFSVDIAASNAELRNNGARVTLAIRARGGTYGPAHVSVTLLNPIDLVMATGEETSDTTGQFVLVSVDASGPKLTSGWTADLIQATRVKYEIRTSHGTTPLSSGVIALSRISRESFKVSVLTDERVRAGTNHTVLVTATGLSSIEAVKGASVHVRLTLDADENTVLERTVRTNDQGTARVDFPIPELPGLDGGTVDVEARRGAVTSEATVDLDLTAVGRAMLISTDKNLYQPGQTLHARILVVDRDRRAARDQHVKLEVKDESGESLFARTLTTSRFGVASADIPLANDAALGEYDIEAVIENETGDDDEAGARVIVSRYELPTFTVRVASDKSFYLPGENATVTVSTTYLFGQPVPGGRVRIHVVDDRWQDDPRNDSDGPAPIAEGTCDATGAFESKIDLGPADDLSPAWRVYRDREYVASVTDPTTNRTERRRFDLRTTREPIHVSVVGERDILPGLPTSFFVITSLADGSVIPCDVTVSEPGPPVTAPDGRVQETWQPVATARTNRYGVARIRSSRIQDELTPHRNGIDLRIHATAADGRTGSIVETLSLADEAVVTVEPRRSILEVGDPIVATVRTSTAAHALMLSVVKDGKVLGAIAAAIRNGQATVRLPFRPEYRGRVSILACDPTAPRDSRTTEPARGSASVLYPQGDELEVRVRPQRESYTPGESLTATVEVRDESGTRTESVLAVAAVDAAVAERFDSGNRPASGGLATRAPWGRNDDGRIGEITLSSIQRMDPERRSADDLDLVAAALLSQDDPTVTGIVIAAARQPRLDASFQMAISRMKGIVDSVLFGEARAQRGDPTDSATLQAALERASAELGRLVDPWGSKLTARSRIDGPWRHLTVSSAGPDAVSDTLDDFVVTTQSTEYFKPTGTRIALAIDAFTAATGRFVRDDAAFREAMRSAGIDADSLRDAWGRPFALRTTAYGTYLVTMLESAGPDGRFDAKLGGVSNGVSDDFVAVRVFTDFYASKVQRLQRALDAAAKRNVFPTDPSTWDSALSSAAIEPGSLADQFDIAPVIQFSRLDGVRDHISFTRLSSFGSSNAAIRTERTPVAEEFDEIRLIGRGLDKLAGTADDVLLARFVHVRSSRTGNEVESIPEPLVTPVLTLYGGAIEGTVTDPEGAVIAGAIVTLAAAVGGPIRQIVTSGDGTYAFQNLSPSLYTITVEAQGFSNSTIEGIPVHSQTTTRLDVELYVAGVGESVSVLAGEELTIVTRNLYSLASLTAAHVMDLPLAPERPAAIEHRKGPVSSTPRLRQYFPETVYWNPELVTDRRGRARIEFPLADSITTWQLSVLASTEDGRVALGSASVLAYQPFFVEHDPPRVLTEGDRIGLPVVVRNYLDSSQSVDLSMAPAPWFSVDGPSNRKIRVEAGASSRQIFDVRAVSSVDDGVQGVTGLGNQASDAIEKPVDVHPHGEESFVTTSTLLSGTGSMVVELPENTIGQPRAKLRLYPNLMSHVVESVEGILERPHGCGEQTISSTYPSLLVLEHSSDDLSPALEARATLYLEEGYERLKSYRAADGGIAYWSGSASDTALTAYALQFLLDAGGLIDVDSGFVAGLRDRLIATQRANGGWSGTQGASTIEDAMEAAYVACALSRLKAFPKHVNAKVTDAVARALAFVEPSVTATGEPYLIASVALAAMDIGDEPIADGAVRKLVAMARDQGDASSWALTTSSPFHGWGEAGEIEATARAVRALASHARRNPDAASSSEARRLADRGMLFLLRKKDRYGVWYSTQATVSVLDAMREQYSTDVRSLGAARSATIRVDGRDVATVELPAPGGVAEPINIDLSDSFGAGQHHVEVVLSDGAAMFAHVVVHYYVPWVDAGRDSAKPNRAEKREDALRLEVEYDRLDAPVGQPVTCTVSAERIGHRGYGMLVAEIGLPPGNDVDRSSLDRAVSNSGWTVCKYDVLPDRVVVYLWPRAGGATFSFRFTTRYGIEAMAAPSSVYDYYNPESNVVLQPPRFRSVE